MRPRDSSFLLLRRWRRCLRSCWPSCVPTAGGRRAAAWCSRRRCATRRRAARPCSSTRSATGRPSSRWRRAASALPAFPCLLHLPLPLPLHVPRRIISRVRSGPSCLRSTRSCTRAPTRLQRPQPRTTSRRSRSHLHSSPLIIPPGASSPPRPQNGLLLAAPDGGVLPLSDGETVQLFQAMFGATRLHSWLKVRAPARRARPLRCGPAPAPAVTSRDLTGRRAPLRQHSLRPLPHARQAAAPAARALRAGDLAVISPWPRL